MPLDPRHHAIATIEDLYPPDSEYPDTAEIGRQLLAEAKDTMSSWRNEPLDVLQEFARLCQREDQRQHPRRIG
jgi:hypothetical protein